MKTPAKLLFSLAKVAVSAALLWFVLRDIDYAETVSNAREARGGLLIFAFLLLAAQPLIAAIRWYAIMRCLGASISFRQSLRLTYVSTLLNQVLPGGVGGDAMRMWFSFREGHLLSHALNGVALDRAAAFLVLIWMAWASSRLLGAYPQLHMLAITLLPLAAIATSGLALIMVLDRLPEGLRKFRAVRGMAYLANDARTVFLRGRNVVLIAFLALLGNANLCASLLMFLLAFNAPIDVGALVLCTSVIILASSLPISVGGWGTREAATVAIMAIFSAPSSSAVVSSITFGVAGILISLPGALSLYRSMSGQPLHAVGEPSLGEAEPRK